MKVDNPVILIVEDEANDQLLIKAAFRKLNVKTPIQIVNNGREAIAYLDGSGEYADRNNFPFPTTIITDLKMPIMDGFSVLEHRRNNPQWAIIPVVVLSSSSDTDDIRRAFILGAAAYHVKPSTSEGLRHLFKAFHDYWMMSEIPETNESGEILQTQSHGKLGERYAEEQ